MSGLQCDGMTEINSIPGVHSVRHLRIVSPHVSAGRAFGPPPMRATFFANLDRRGSMAAGGKSRRPFIELHNCTPAACLFFFAARQPGSHARRDFAEGCEGRPAHVGKHGATNVRKMGKAIPNSGKQDDSH